MMTNKKISEKTADPDPFVQFSGWYREHLSAGIEIPETVSLGTASTAGKVSVRTVLMKSFDEKGFVFYTNYNSKKGTQLAENPYAAMLFYWPESGCQIRIEGRTVKVSEKESEIYFRSRPRESQLSAWTSDQSSVIPDRLFLEERQAFFNEKFSGREVDKPLYWGGYRLIPDLFEFWLDGEFRLHDRIVYTRSDRSWTIKRLAP